ncbi:hypothetical protein [Nocardia iowensis]|uniref:DUF222 domain-containing protein n=1 Tax=Nocardia iowensis TaxID=204891 RepID=A0ABX8RPM2_NOCIO|nr:hypothetical protein [Nocardia iowensis]QXN91584.1 hypothetical protein KV110_40915 [Nocardia iowensis]
MQLTNLNMHVAAMLACGTDPGVMTNEQAHAAMQLHLDCTVDRCLVRRRARTTLVEAGKCVLDERALPS